MDKIEIDYVKLQNIITSLDKETSNLKRLFDLQDNNFKLLDDNSIWSGNSKEVCLKKYNMLSNQYNDIISNLNTYKDYISNAGEAYKILDQNLSNQIDSNK